MKRTLLICDTENLAGQDPRFTSEEEYRFWLGRFRRTAAPTLEDHVIAASHPNPRAAFAAKAVFPGALLRTRHGRNGADTALIAEISEPVFVSDRYSTVVIGSGDGAFVDPVVQLSQRGVRVIVVARRGHISRRLIVAAEEVRFLPEQTDHEPLPISGILASAV